MSDMFLALQEQKITALREQLALKYTQISGLWAENAELHAALSKSKAELDEWRFTNKIDEMQREIERLSTHVVKSQPVEPVAPELLDCDIAPRPLSYTLREYHIAPSEGPLNFTWQDKPHRLLYDLIAAVKYYAHPVRPMSDWLSVCRKSGQS